MRNVFYYLKRKIPHDKKVVMVEPVYRDDLTKKQTPKKKVKKTVRFAETEPTILGEDCKSENEIEKGKNSGNSELGEKEGIRVKVKMTKEEAARFLSKCNSRGVFEFKDVALELVSIPVNRVFVMPSSTKDFQQQ